MGGNYLYYCEICKKPADKHHIIFKSEGGQDFPLNFKYLCPEHHRGRIGPHKNEKINLIYRIEMQEKLYELLPLEFYTLDKLSLLLDINPNHMKRILNSLKRYKEGYKTSEVIFKLMGNNSYTEESLIEFSLCAIEL